MATGTAQPTVLPPAPPVPGESRERERLIQRQLARTSLYVRLIDLASGIAIWIIGVVLLFIVAALVDHFVGLGSIGRCTALAVLLAGSLWYLVMHVAPLVVRAINPAYAARTIEEASPSLKNSLINFLLLRQDRTGIKEIVYQAVERQAATDISTVPVESAVDRTRLIYAGYVLCAVMAIFAAYKILSPKDPFQTVARVLAPWADIARPSRVQISDVEPGSTQVYHGQTVTISATVRGTREGDAVNVLYSTADGQAIDQPVAMKLSAGDRYECILPPGESGAVGMAAGLQQDVTYRIVAGDAESFPYRLNVVSSPTIIVERLEYQFPAYTKKAAESVAQQGDIKALEGTKVTIHAIANQPIKSAWIEFDPVDGEGASEKVPLTAEGERARGTITLLLKGENYAPWHSTYQVRFLSEGGELSRQPILHKIEVIRDLPPEVQILKPESLRVEVPEDGSQPIEVRGVDPDFGLSSLRIEGAVGNKPPLVIELLDTTAGEPPQATVPYTFQPREHNLKAGDELRYTAVAKDNRTSPQTGQAEPNIAGTKEYTLVVVRPQSNEQRQGGQNQQQPDPKNQQQPNQQPEKQPQAGPQNAQQNNDQKQRPDEQPQPPKNDGGQGNQQQQPGQQSDGQKEQQQKSDPGNSDSKQGSQQPQRGQGQEGQKGDQQKDGQQQNGQSSGGQSGERQEGQQQGGQQQGGQQQGGQQQNGGNQQGQSGGKTGQAGDPQQGQQQGQQQGEARPDAGSNEGQGKAQHDGQAIERIWKELQKRGQDAQPGDQPQPGGPNQQNGQQQQGEAGQSQPGQRDQAQPAQGDQASREQGDDARQQNAKGDKRGSQPGGQPQAEGQSGAQGENTPGGGKPEANDQRQEASGQGTSGEGKAGKSGDRLPDAKQGQNSSEQKSGGSKGGESHGPTKTDRGEKSSPSQGEQRDAGAGKVGDEGAGQASEDKSGSGDGNFKNRDRNKELKPEDNAPQPNEPSPANSSSRQSDSKGGTSGENSGGGKQGAGQAGAQEGNDSAGSKSAGDQGAGKANETGSGEVGDKAGAQKEATGKTGQSGDQQGAGSGSRPGEEAAPPGAKPGEKSDGKGGKRGDQQSDQRGQAQGGAGSQPVGGADDQRERFQEKVDETQNQEADAANLEYARKATEMVLKRLKDEEHNPDPDLLEKLGWTREELAEFLRRWEALQKSANQSPEGQRELDESLRSLGLRDPVNRQRAGGKASDDQRGMRDAGNRSSPPPRYRELFDAFRKGAARSPSP